MQDDLKNPNVRADEANRLVNDEVFKRVMQEMRASYVDQLVALEVSSPGVVDVHAKLRALDDIKWKLGQLANPSIRKQKR